MSIVFNLAAQFTGKKAFKEADKAVGGLENGAKKLGKALGLALGTAAITAYGKAAFKAFTDDQAAAQRLAIAVDNLGLSFSKSKVEDFIAKTEQSAGILDDKLRPAMQALLTTTGSLTKSQELLNNAITISRASGIDLATVSQDLANGYVGITKGLKKYNTGLTQSELKTKSFSEVLGVILANSAGAAQAYMDTTAYKMDVLNVAAANAKETIGSGLVDAFAKISGGTTAADAAHTIDNIAKAIKGVTSVVGGAIGGIVNLYRKFDEFTYNFDPILGDSKAQQDLNKKFRSGRSSSPAGTWKRTQQQRAAEAAAAKRAKELAAFQAKQVNAAKALSAEQKKQAALKKAGSIFDLEQIQIIAALQGKISEDEKLRLHLQLALLMGNDEYAKSLSEKLAASQLKTAGLAQALKDLPTPINPFSAWITDLDKTLAKLREIAAFNQPSTGNGSSARGSAFPALNSTVSDLVTGASGASAGSTKGGDVYISIGGSVVSEQDLVAAVQNGLQYNSLAGKPSDIGRIAGMFG